MEHAWEIVCASATRWNSAEHVRFEKSARHSDTFRVQEQEAQRTCVRLVTLAARFRQASLAPAHRHARTRVVHCWCPRSDWRLEKGRMPLYRLRWALT